MGSFIQAAKQQLLDTIQLLSADSDIDLQVCLVEYRDHPTVQSFKAIALGTGGQCAAASNAKDVISQLNAYL